MLNQLLDRYCRVLNVLIAVFLAVMVVLVFGNVVLRYGFNSGITLSEELSRWLFVWMTFLGAIVAMKEGAHLGSDTLVSRLPIVWQKAFLVIGHVLMLFVCWLLFRGSYEQVLINMDSASPVMEVSMGYFYACGAVLAVSGAFAGKTSIGPADMVSAGIRIEYNPQSLERIIEAAVKRPRSYSSRRKHPASPCWSRRPCSAPTSSASPSGHSCAAATCTT